MICFMVLLFMCRFWILSVFVVLFVSFVLVVFILMVWVWIGMCFLVVISNLVMVVNMVNLVLRIFWNLR